MNRMKILTAVLAFCASSAQAHEPQTAGEALTDGVITGMGGDPGAYDRGYAAGSAGAGQAWIDGYEAGAGMTPGPYEVPSGGLYDGGIMGMLGGGGGGGGSSLWMEIDQEMR